MVDQGNVQSLMAKTKKENSPALLKPGLQTTCRGVDETGPGRQPLYNNPEGRVQPMPGLNRHPPCALWVP